MIYKASLDKLTKAITVVFTLLLAILIIRQYLIFKNIGELSAIYLAIAMVFIYFIAYAFRPIRYELSAGKLIIHRFIGDVKIDRTEIKSVELLDKSKIGWSFRTFGVGGVFGYYGKFLNKKYGSMTWYATRSDKTVLIQTLKNKKIVLTPDNPEQFVADINR